MGQDTVACSASVETKVKYIGIFGCIQIEVVGCHYKGNRRFIVILCKFKISKSSMWVGTLIRG